MKTNLVIAIRYSVLVSLLMLLWISLEYMVGLHDQFAAYHPATTLLSYSIVIFCCYRAYREKIRTTNGNVGFAELSGLGILIAVFSALLAAPVLYLFFTFINPDFFISMINYARHNALATGQDMEAAKLDATRYMNLYFYVGTSVLLTFVVGFFAALALAWRMSPRKS